MLYLVIMEIEHNVTHLMKKVLRDANTARWL